MGTYEVIRGDIFLSDAEALVNTVNCKGVMGRGLALQFRRRFPDNFVAYRAECESGTMALGRVHVFETGRMSPRFIFNFPTKDHWRNKSSIEDIKTGLRSLDREVRRLGIKSIAIPALGCDLGGLEWDEVRPLIEATVDSVPGLRAGLYTPNPGVAFEPAKAKRKVKMTRARAGVVCLTHAYLRAGAGLMITNLELQKLMYFMQIAGERLNLRITKGDYGPYSPNLQFVLKDIEGVYITGYEEVGDSPGRELYLMAGAIDEAEQWLSVNDETKMRIERVNDLVDGFESQLGLEALATVHWVARETGSSELDRVVAGVHAWNSRKREILNRWQIEVCLNRLIEKGWIDHAASA